MASPAISGAAIAPKLRSRATNRPFSVLDLSSAEGRRVRDVAIALLRNVPDPSDPLVISDAIAAAAARESRRADTRTFYGAACRASGASPR